MRTILVLFSLLISSCIYSQSSFGLRVFGGPTYSLANNSSTVNSPVPSNFEVVGKLGQSFGIEVKYKSVFARIQTLTTGASLHHDGFPNNYSVDVFEKAQTLIIAVGNSFNLGESTFLKVALGYGKTERSSYSYTSTDTQTKIGDPDNNLKLEAEKGLLIQLGIQTQPFKNNQNFLRKFDLELALDQFLYRINQFDYSNTISINNQSYFFSYRNRPVLTTLNLRIGYTIFSK